MNLGFSRICQRAGGFVGFTCPQSCPLYTRRDSDVIFTGSAREPLVMVPFITIFVSSVSPSTSIVVSVPEVSVTDPGADPGPGIATLQATLAVIPFAVLTTSLCEHCAELPRICKAEVPLCCAGELFILPAISGVMQTSLVYGNPGTGELSLAARSFISGVSSRGTPVPLPQTRTVTS